MAGRKRTKVVDPEEEKREREQKKAKLEADYEARKQAYAKIQTMEELKQFVKDEVKRRVALPKPDYGELLKTCEKTIWRGGIHLAKTTMLSEQDFDGELLRRAAEFIKAGPKFKEAKVEANAKLAALKIEVNAKLDELIAVEDRYSQLQEDVQTLCGNSWKWVLENRREGKERVPYGTRLFKLQDEVDRLEERAERQGFEEMIKDAQAGRTKINIRESAYM
jgi:hypothetical protein